MKKNIFLILLGLFLPLLLMGDSTLVSHSSNDIKSILKIKKYCLDKNSLILFKRIIEKGNPTVVNVNFLNKNFKLKYNKPIDLKKQKKTILSDLIEEQILSSTPGKIFIIIFIIVAYLIALSTSDIFMFLFAILAIGFIVFINNPELFIEPKIQLIQQAKPTKITDQYILVNKKNKQNLIIMTLQTKFYKNNKTFKNKEELVNFNDIATNIQELLDCCPVKTNVEKIAYNNNLLLILKNEEKLREYIDINLIKEKTISFEEAIFKYIYPINLSKKYILNVFYYRNNCENHLNKTDKKGNKND